jgi:hypothetical protein
VGVLVQDGVQVADEVVLQYDLVGQQMWQDGKGSCIELGETIAEVLVCELVCVCGTLEVDLVLVKGDVVAVRACLLVL